MPRTKKTPSITLLDDTISKKREEECVEFLKEKGYRVGAPLPNKDIASNIDTLIDYFYFSMQAKFPDRKIQPSPARTSDRGFISIYIKSRINSGISKKRAYIEYTEVVDALFKFYQELRIEKPVMSLSFLLDWNLMAQIVDAINEESLAKQFEFEKRFDKETEDFYQDQELQETILKELQIMQDKVRNNGKKD